MVIIFGWGSSGAEDRGEIVPIVCPRCHNHVVLHEIQSKGQVSLYFVSMASYDTDLYLACPICHAGLQVRPEHRASLAAMRSATHLFRAGGLGAEAYQAHAERFLAEMGVATPRVPVNAPDAGPAPTSAPDPPPISLADDLAALGKLHAEGTLTDAEFAAAKRRVLDR